MYSELNKWLAKAQQLGVRSPQSRLDVLDEVIPAVLATKAPKAVATARRLLRRRANIARSLAAKR